METHRRQSYGLSGNALSSFLCALARPPTCGQDHGAALIRLGLSEHLCKELSEERFGFLRGLKAHESGREVAASLIALPAVLTMPRVPLGQGCCPHAPWQQHVGAGEG